MTAKRHHYIPVFYLKRWAGLDGRIIEFSRRYREVKPRRTHPAGTGYEERLYEARIFDDDRRSHIESVFLQGVDSRAADALKMLEDGNNNWTVTTRSAWTRFIISLQIRTPADIAALRSEYVYRWRETFVEGTEEEEEIYQQAKAPYDPPNFREYIAATSPEALDFMALGVFARLHNLANMGSRINGMKWNVIRLPGRELKLLTSDRPVYMSAFGQRPAHLTLPIGPDKLFVAYDDGFPLERLRDRRPSDLVKSLNTANVSKANNLVLGNDDTALPFVRRLFATTPQTSFFMRVRAQALSNNGA